ncbi:MAG: AAA family ATPase [Armatimonadetes bacterium]|nr:AAA family ATPase [Armatimonadota bacterium]
MTDWRNLYAKRDVDAQLISFYAAAKAGKPQFVVLLAETGWGKTRAVQHFYEHLRQTEDPNGYWPNNLTADPEPNRPRRSAVNPSLEGHTSPIDRIAYLWWGIRFSPDAHTGGVSAYLSHIMPRLFAIALRQDARNIKEQEKAEWKKLFTELAGETTEALLGLLGLLIPMMKAGKSLNEIRKKIQERKAQADAPTPTVGQAARQERESLADRVSEAMRAVLNPGDDRHQTVPVVIVLDDAQWADPDSLSVIEKIWQIALTNRWKLLIVATHWAGDYQKFKTRDRKADPTLRLPDLRMGGQHAPAWHEIDLSKAVPLTAITRAAFPQMSDAQVQQFTSLAEGHPLYLRELILQAKKHPAWFKNSDAESELTEEGMGKCQAFRGLHDLAQERFDSQPPAVRAILAWGSRQGMQFLHRLTRAHAEDNAFQPCYNGQEHDEAVQNAQREALLDALQEVDGSEFDQVAFRQAAAEHLDNEPDHVKSALTQSLRETLARYSTESALATVPEPEQIPLLSIAVKELRPGGAPDVNEGEWQAWARAVWLLFKRLRAGLLWMQAEAVALQLAPENLPPEGWSFETLDFWDQHDLFLFLRSFRELGAAGRLANGLKIRTEPAAKRADANAETRKLYSVALDCVGDAQSALRQWQDALANYNESLRVCRQIVEEFGETPESLRDLSVSLSKVGDVQSTLLQWEPALAQYQKSLRVRRQIVEEFGETPESLRDLSVSLNKVGDVQSALRQWQDALANYNESLKARRQIVESFGATPESLRDLSVSLDNVGDAQSALLQWQDALANYNESLRVRRQIVEEFGETPESLRDLSVSLEKVGDAQSALLQWQDALANYNESLRVCRQIVESFGATPESLRDLLVSHAKLSQVYAGLGDRTTACEHAREVLRLAKILFQNHPDDPQTQEDLRNAEQLVLSLGC